MLEAIVAEDLDYLASLDQRDDITNLDLRHASTTLRRLLVHDDLQKVANARGIRLIVNMPDVKAVERATERDENALYYQVAGTRAFGVEYTLMCLDRGQARSLQFDPDGIYAGRLDTFKKQRVFFARAWDKKPVPGQENTFIVAPFPTFISREMVIKYVANKAGGDHYDAARERDEEWVLDLIRRAVSVSSENGMPTFSIDQAAFHDPQHREKKPVPRLAVGDAKHLDPVFLELYSACRFLVSSRSVMELRATIG